MRSAQAHRPGRRMRPATSGENRARDSAQLLAGGVTLERHARGGLGGGAGGPPTRTTHSLAGPRSYTGFGLAPGAVARRVPGLTDSALLPILGGS
jgi:hypothetical protein